MDLTRAAQLARDALAADDIDRLSGHLDDGDLQPLLDEMGPEERGRLRSALRERDTASAHAVLGPVLGAEAALRTGIGPVGDLEADVRAGIANGAAEPRHPVSSDDVCQHLGDDDLGWVRAAHEEGRLGWLLDLLDTDDRAQFATRLAADDRPWIRSTLRPVACPPPHAPPAAPRAHAAPAAGAVVGATAVGAAAVGAAAVGAAAVGAGGVGAAASRPKVHAVSADDVCMHLADSDLTWLRARHDAGQLEGVLARLPVAARQEFGQRVARDDVPWVRETLRPHVCPRAAAAAATTAPAQHGGAPGWLKWLIPVGLLALLGVGLFAIFADDETDSPEVTVPQLQAPEVTESPDVTSPSPTTTPEAALAPATYSVFFDTAESTLDEGDSATITQAAARIQQDSDGVTVQVVGVTDPRGDAAYNETLSQARAASVIAALRAAGATDADYQVSTTPEQGNGDDQQARRVDVVVPSD